MQTLVNQIIEEQKQIDEKLKQKNPKLDFYKEFFERYHITTTDDILQIDTCDLLVAIIAKESLSQPLNKIKDVVYSNRNFFENIDKDSFRKLMEVVIMLDDAEILSDIICYLKSKELPPKNDESKREIRTYTKEFMKMAESIESTPKDFAKILEFIIDDIFISFRKATKGPDKDFAFFEAIIYADVLRRFSRERQEHQDILQDYLNHNPKAKLKNKDRPKLMNGLAKVSGWKIDGIVSEISRIRQAYEEMNSQENTRRKKLNKSKNANDEILKQMLEETKRKDRQIRIPEKNLSKIPSAAVKNSALRVIYEHNLDLCEKKEAEYLDVAANATTRYQLLLANYGISPNQYEVGTILHQTLPDIEIMLQELTKIHITNPTLLLSIIQTSDLETTKNYVCLFDKGIITSELLASHPSLFNPRTKEYENMMRNLATIKHHSINPHYFTTSEEVLITPSETFSHNIETLEEYQLAQTIKKEMNISFLAEPGIAEAIDTLLELGYEKNLETTPELLNYQDKFARLRILKELNIQALSTEELLNVLTTDKFYVPDSMIKNYIYNAVDYNLPENITLLETPKKKSSDLARLEEFSKTSRTYDFDGVTISKNRVARNLNEVKQNGKVEDRLVYSILKGATLNDEEVAKVKSTIGVSKSDAPTKQKN